MRHASRISSLRDLLLPALAAAVSAALAPATPAAGQVPSAEAQIAAATLPLPEEMRDGAAVIGYDEAAERIELRAGGNGMICVADDPSDERFRSACYPESLHPLIARDQELRGEGLEEEERVKILEEEVEGGRIALPDHPATLHRLAGPAGSYDASGDTVTDEVRRFKMIFTPYRTAEEMGLPAERVGNMPWVMDSGELFSHIMVVPGDGEDDRE
jgi:hypothetical protein